MPIRAGEQWGANRPLPEGAPIVASDAELRDLVIDHRDRGRPIPVVGLLGGDLCRTLGGHGDRARLEGPDAVTVAVDLGTAIIDGAPTVFVAHLVVGRPFASGTVVMQAQWLDDLDLGPRSHPGDGWLDVTSGSVPIGQRRTARRRARTGTHLPHPGLRHERKRAGSLEFDRPTAVVIDGVPSGRHRRVEFGIEQAALRVVV